MFTPLGFFPLFEGPRHLGRQIGSHKICFPLQKWQTNMNVYLRTFIPPATQCQNGVVNMSRFTTLHQQQNYFISISIGFKSMQQQQNDIKYLNVVYQLG